MSVKVIVVGQYNCGKTCLINRIETGEFDSGIPNTIGFSFKTIELKGKSFQFHDLSGKDTYRNIVTNLFHNAKIALIVYSINSMSSFQEADIWYDKIKELLNINDPENVDYVSLILVGTKSDLNENRQVSNEQGEEKAESFGQTTKFIEVSSKNGENINILIDIITDLSNRITRNHPIDSPPINQTKNNSGCC